MFRGLASGVFFVLVVSGANSAAISSPMVIFDFDNIQSHSKKAATARAVQAYMEELFGGDVLVSQKTAGVNSSLMIGKGKGAPSIILDFGENPINSFAVDYQLFKKAKSFTILADGEVINLQTPSKIGRKTGLTGQQTAIFFDSPVQSLQFIGKNKKSFAIDNLVINIPSGSAAGGDLDESDISTNGAGFRSSNSAEPLAEGLGSMTSSINLAQGLATVPESSSLALLTFGLIVLTSRKRLLRR